MIIPPGQVRLGVYDNTGMIHLENYPNNTYTLFLTTVAQTSPIHFITQKMIILILLETTLYQTKILVLVIRDFRD